MDEMNPLENQLQSWTPRRPSPKIAHRLFGQAANVSSRPVRRFTAWNWFSPVAACALTMLVVVHTASRTAVQVPQGSNATSFATLVLSATVPSNIENLEWNVWTHPHTQYAMILPGEVGLKHDIWNSVPTNR